MKRKEINERGWNDYAENWEKNKQQWQIPGLALADHSDALYLGDEWNLMCKNIKRPYGVNCYSNEEFKGYLSKKLLEPFLPTGYGLNIMEIGPGGGRITEMLLAKCEKLYAVDISEKMLAELRKRFPYEQRIEYILTDGKKISGIPANSVDCMITFDAFVHTEPYEIFKYLDISESLLKPGGVGIVHFSDVETDIGFQKFRHDVDGLLANGPAFHNFSIMSKNIMRKFVEELGLQVIALTNEIIPRDAVVVFRKKKPAWCGHSISSNEKQINTHRGAQPKVQGKLTGGVGYLSRNSNAGAQDGLKTLIEAHPEREEVRVLSDESRPKAVWDLMNSAIKSLQQNDVQRAFDSLIKAKSLRHSVRGLDYLRGICFAKKNQLADAREALKEELRYFPDNAEARNLLNQLSSQLDPVAICGAGDPVFREIYRIVRPFSMLSDERLYSLFRMAKHICTENIPGNFVECGVAAGGSAALLGAVLKRYSKQTRWLYAFDTFEGMPEPTEHDTHDGQGADATGWGSGTCAAPEQSVHQLCAKLGALDVLKIVKGTFERTLPKMRDTVGMISLLHMDGDWYESTRAILHNLYDRVVHNGFIQVDDYGYWEGCRKAIEEFEAERGIRFGINRIDSTGVWFVKPDKFPVNNSIAPEVVVQFNEEYSKVKHIESQMSPNERFQLYYAVQQHLSNRANPIRFIEIGSWAGASLLLICSALKKLNRSFQGFAIEPTGHSQFQQVINGLRDSVQHLKMYSYQAAEPLKSLFERDGNFPGLIFVDGDHTYQGVRQDILDYYPLLAPRGVMIFHDFLPPLNDKNREAIFSHHGRKEPGIRRACQEILEERHHCEVIDIPLLYPSDPTQTQPHLAIIPGVFSTIRAYRKPSD